MKVVDDEWLCQLVSGVSIPTNDGIEEDSSNLGNAEILLSGRKGKFQMIGGEAQGKVAGAEGGGALTLDQLGAGSWCHARRLVPTSLTIRQISGPFPTTGQPYTASPHPMECPAGGWGGGRWTKNRVLPFQSCRLHTFRWHHIYGIYII